MPSVEDVPAFKSESVTAVIGLYEYVDGNPVSGFDPLGYWWFGDPLPPGVVNAGVGFGDGVVAAVTFGRVRGQDLRDLLNIPGNGGANVCSSTYQLSFVAGTLDAIVAEGGAFASAAPSAKSAAQATYVALRLLSGGAETATTGEEVTSALEQLQQVVEQVQDATANRPIQPPPGVPNYRY